MEITERSEVCILLFVLFLAALVRKDFKDIFCNYENCHFFSLFLYLERFYGQQTKYLINCGRFVYLSQELMSVILQTVSKYRVCHDLIMDFCTQLAQQKSTLEEQKFRIKFSTTWLGWSDAPCCTFYPSRHYSFNQLPSSVFSPSIFKSLLTGVM